MKNVRYLPTICNTFWQTINWVLFQFCICIYHQRNVFALAYFRTLPLIEFSSGFVCVGIKPMAMETYVLFKKLVRKFSEGITFQISTFGKRAHPQDIRSGKVR